MRLRRGNSVALAAAMVMLGATAATAQDVATPPPGSAAFAPDSGATAPDFTLPGANKAGVLKNPIKLSDFRGQTVVLAFFPKARTKG
jgi:peroxiredoxin Q/BCP